MDIYFFFLREDVGYLLSRSFIYEDFDNASYLLFVYCIMNLHSKPNPQIQCLLEKYLLDHFYEMNDFLREYHSCSINFKLALENILYVIKVVYGNE